MFIRKLANLLLPFVLGLSVTASLAAWPGPLAAQGMGIYPTELSFEDTARGGEYYRTVGVINSSKSEVVFSLDGEGPITQWISFVEAKDRSNEIETLNVPGSSESQTLVRLKVPDDAANGEYQGYARIVAQNGGGSLSVGASIDVSVTVTGDQRLEGSLVDGSVNDIEAGSPLRVRALVKNSGNVRFTPEVSVEILDEDQNVVTEEIVSEGASVFPNETGELENELDISDLDLGEGEYTASISARAGGLDLGTRVSSFTVFPIGTLTRQGVLKEIVLEVTPKPGDLGKLGVVFANTGQIDTLAKFIGELYRQDRLVEVLETDELLVPVSQQKTLELFFQVDEPGDYLIKGKVNYQGKETSSRDFAFTVVEAESVETIPEVVSQGSSVGGAGEPSLSNQPEEDLSVGQRASNTLSESSFTSPLGIAVIALGALVVILLLVLLLTRRPRRYRY